MGVAGPPQRSPAGPPLGAPPAGFVRTGPPTLPDSPPAGWGGSPVLPATDHTEYQPSDGWRPWQAALLGVLGVLVGMCFGLVIGVQLADPGDGSTLLDRTIPTIGPNRAAPNITGPPAASGSETGAVDNPIQIGQRYILGAGWTVRVVEVDEDAGDVVVDESPLNEPPGPNESYVLVTLEMTFTEPGFLGQPQDVLLSLRDAGGTRFFAFEYSCGRIPDPLTGFSEVSEGQSITGNACFAVPANLVDDMVLVAEVLAGEAVHFALR
jgi:hypothetical protein